MRVLVLGAGGPAGVNVMRALRAAGHEPVGADGEESHLVYADPYGETMTLDQARSVDVLGNVDVVMAQPDPLVLSLAHGHDMPARFLPKPQTIALCQDKFECGLAWRRAGLREDRIELMDAGESFARPFEAVWLRARHGAGAKAAVRAGSAHAALHWMNFWYEREPEIQFLSEGVLPGRDFSWCGIYYEGELLVSFARERLEYIYPHLTPEGLTGTPTIARIVNSAGVDEMAELAVDAVDDEPHGVFCVDLREDADGQPRPTEINAGRFSTTVGLWSIAQPDSNYVALAAELAVSPFGEAKRRLEDWASFAPGLTLSRHIDCGHHFTMVEALTCP